jgi:hypothetical protein
MVSRVLVSFLLVMSAPFGLLYAQSLSVRLVRERLLNNFPSASSIVFFDQKFYLTGDDSKSILVLNGNYQVVDSIRLFSSSSLRIPKEEKFDIESAVSMGGLVPKIVLFGSGASKQRERMLKVPFNPRNGKIRDEQGKFFDSIRSIVGSLNIEGAACMGRDIVFANRSISEVPNKIISTNFKAILKGNADTIHTTALTLHDSIKGKIGISDIGYVPATKLLLITFSSEETDNPLEDGAIGDSYIGWIADFDGKLSGSQIALDGLINLSMADSRFRGEKIEGICVEKISKGTITAHLVSDNDDGKSMIFKVEMNRIEKLKN